MTKQSEDFFPASETALALVPGLSVTTNLLSSSQTTSWRSHSAATVFLFCKAGRLRVDIDRPMFSADLYPGEIYTFPPNLTYRLGATSGDAQFVAIRSGQQWDVSDATVAHEDREPFLREPPVRSPIAALNTAGNNLDGYRAGYTRVDVLARTEELRCLILGLGEMNCVPWHSHKGIEDTFFCMQGPMRVETRDPDARFLLQPGDSCVAAAGQPHFVSGTEGNPCQFLIIQGVGQYSYVPFKTDQLGQPIQ